MITLLTGENSFGVETALTKISQSFDGVAEMRDGSQLTLAELPDLLMGGTLFATQRLVIIRELSSNKSLWASLGEWLTKVSDDIHLVLIESKLDKRTKTTKELLKQVTIKEFTLWSDRDQGGAAQWVRETSQEMGMTIGPKEATQLVRQVGLDQWQLYHALEKLSVLAEVTSAAIAEYIETNPSENVFELFDASLRGESQRVQDMLATLSTSEDPFRLFGLLSGQAFQLSVLAVAEKSSTDVAKEIGVHPYGLSKLAPHARRLGPVGVRHVVSAFAEADKGMKTSATDPWLLIERALVKVTRV